MKQLKIFPIKSTQFIALTHFLQFLFRNVSNFSIYLIKAENVSRLIL